MSGETRDKCDSFASHTKWCSSLQFRRQNEAWITSVISACLYVSERPKGWTSTKCVECILFILNEREIAAPCVAINLYSMLCICIVVVRHWLPASLFRCLFNYLYNVYFVFFFFFNLFHVFISFIFVYSDCYLYAHIKWKMRDYVKFPHNETTPQHCLTSATTSPPRSMSALALRTAGIRTLVGFHVQHGLLCFWCARQHVGRPVLRCLSVTPENVEM